MPLRMRETEAELSVFPKNEELQLQQAAAWWADQLVKGVLSCVKHCCMCDAH